MAEPKGPISEKHRSIGSALVSVGKTLVDQGGPIVKRRIRGPPTGSKVRDGDNSLIWIASGLPTIGAEMEDAIHARVSRVLPALVD